MHALTKMKYAAGFLLGALALVMGGEAAAESAPMSTAPMCIPADTERAIASCPAGAKKEVAKEGGNAPVSRMTAAGRKQITKQGPTGPSLQIDMSTRLGREQTIEPEPPEVVGEHDRGDQGHGQGARQQAHVVLPRPDRGRNRLRCRHRTGPHAPAHRSPWRIDQRDLRSGLGEDGAVNPLHVLPRRLDQRVYRRLCTLAFFPG